MVHVKNQKLYKFIYIFLGLLVGIGSFYLNSPIKPIGALLGLFFIGLSLSNFEISLCLFLLGFSIIPHSLWNNLYSVLAIGFFTIIFFIKVANKRYKFKFKYIDIFLIVFILSGALATVLSIVPNQSFKTLLFLVTSIMLSIILSNVINSKKTLKIILLTIFIAVIITSLFAAYQRVAGVQVNESLTDTELNRGMPGRVFSTMANPNNYAEYLVMLLPLCVAYVLSIKNKYKRNLFGLALIFPLIALGMTYSRSGWLGFACAVGVFILLTNWKLIPPMLILGILMIPFLPQTIVNRISTIGNLKDSSNSYRIYIWKGVMPLLKDYWVTGIGLGPGPFSYLYPNYALTYLGDTKVTAVHSHILLIEVWLEMGIVAFISLIGYMLRIIKQGLIKTYKTKDSDYKRVLIACISGLAGVNLIGLVEYVWFYPRVLLTFWMVIGIFIATIRLTREVSIK